MEADEGVQYQQHRAHSSDCFTQALTVLRQIQQEPRGGYHEQGQILDQSIGSIAYALKTLMNDSERVFSGKKQHRPRTPDREAAQTGCT